MIEAATAAVLVTGLVLLDAFCIPRAKGRIVPRSVPGTLVLLCFGTALFGMLLIMTGAPITAAVATLLLVASTMLISNVKHAVLGEPLVFSDFALMVAVFQQPQFYVSALKRWQIVFLVSVLLALVGSAAGLSSSELFPRLMGAGLALAGSAVLAALLHLSIWQPLAQAPDLTRDVWRHGLMATTLVYWFHWRRLADPPECEIPAIPGYGNQLVIIVQCESFTDPTDLFGDPSLALPGLAAAQSVAAQTGRLEVHGFGAYTMRTEYGVLFGRSQEQLGLRRFDPFLSARGETSWALPNRLRRDQWTSIFLHPHDLRFYGRDSLMPKAGFDQIIGADHFPRPTEKNGRYVTDAAVCDAIFEVAEAAPGATLIYAVTIENHGPWPVQDHAIAKSHGAAYLHLLRRSDAMLLRLIKDLPRLGRPVTLCFFGDHRPSIPDVSEPGTDRHTPYVIASFAPDGTAVMSGAPAVHLTPAAVHHALLAAIRSGGRE